MPRIHVIIPARFSSQRLPGKPLAIIAGKPMIQHVFERVSACGFIDGVTVATDDQRIVDAVNKFGGTAEMTSSEHQNGTLRVADVAKSISAEIIINLQGDEPLIKPDDIEKVVAPLINDAKVKVSSLMTSISKKEDFLNPTVVKVLVNQQNFAIYFSRWPIPFNMKLWSGEAAPISEQWINYLKNLDSNQDIAALTAFKHIGIYAFKREALLKYPTWKPSAIEQAEQLEQLRFINNGFEIKMSVTKNHQKGVDTPADLEEVRKLMESL